MDQHAIHRLTEFLPHLARRQPELFELLPDSERPLDGVPLNEWAEALTGRRPVEICTLWVIDCLRRLRERSPLSNVLLAACLRLPGEFELQDAAAVAIGEIPKPDDPRHGELRRALAHAVRQGVLIHIPKRNRYCIPFPVRLASGDAPFLDAEVELIQRMRLVRHYADACATLKSEHELIEARDWRFSNFFHAFETAVDLAEELMGAEPLESAIDAPVGVELPHPLLEPLVLFGLCLGKAVIQRASDSGLRLLMTSLAAAEQLRLTDAIAELQSSVGRFHLRRGAYGRAIEWYRKLESSRLSAGDHESVVVAISAIAIAHREMGNVELAIGEFQRARALSAAWRLAEAEVDTTNCAARLMIAEDRFLEARRLCEASVDSGEKSLRRYPAFAELLILLAEALGAEGRFAEARDRALAGLAHARSTTHRLAEAQACLTLGRLHRLEERKDDALTWLRRARGIFLELSDPVGLGETYAELAESLPVGETTETSERLLARALRCAEIAGRPDIAARLWMTRAARSTLHGRHAEACLERTHAATALRKARQIHRLPALYAALALDYRELADFHGCAQAILRSQAIRRAYAPQEPASNEELTLLPEMALNLGEAHFELLVGEVTEELEAGELGLA